MKLRFTIILAITYFFLVSGTIDLSNLFNYAAQPIPNYINRDNTTNGNAITDEGATLGRVLFYDKNLSLNNTIACASCHQQQFGFSDTAVQSVGQDGGLTGRHSMRLINARFSNENRFFWDKRAATLEAQTTQPIQDHIEMGFSGTNGQPNLDSLIRKMGTIDYYQSLFPLAFGDNTITEDRMQQALAQFVRSIQSFDSKYDTGRAANGNNNGNFPNFTASENRGKQLFMTPPNNNGAGCNGCHQAPGFDLRNNSGNNGVVTVAGNPGATDGTNRRSPSLRDLVNANGMVNGPMMHDGSKATLRAVIDHYNNVPQVNGLDRRLRGGGGNLNLTEQEKIDLENFLLTLTGSDVYTNEKWTNPFDASGNLSVLDGNCETNLTLNTNITSGTQTFVASNSISANPTISNATITYRAGSAITLTNGFTVSGNATFIATIGNCSALSEETTPTAARIIDEELGTNMNKVGIGEEEIASSSTVSLDNVNLRVYPNPFRNELTINLGRFSENWVEIQLYNAVGQAIKQWTIQNQMTVDLSQLEKGIYFLRAIENGELLSTTKIIKASAE